MNLFDYMVDKPLPAFHTQAATPLPREGIKKEIACSAFLGEFKKGRYGTEIVPLNKIGNKFAKSFLLSNLDDYI
jgi:hypothetical protein